MKRFLKDFHKSERGFTLIELLVVVGILGVIAAVVILNVGGFIGTGTLEAANTELHQVQTAVVAAMTTSGATTITGGTVGPAADLSGLPGDVTAGQFLLNKPQLQAVYTIGTDGGVTDATKTDPSKWGDLLFDLAQGGWYKP